MRIKLNKIKLENFKGIKSFEADLGGANALVRAENNMPKPITEHPDVQRLIIQVETLSQENKELKNKLTYIRKRYPEIDEMEQALKEPNDAG